MTNYFNEQIADLVRKRDQAYTIYKIVSDAHQVNVHDLNTKRRGVYFYLGEIYWGESAWLVQSLLGKKYRLDDIFGIEVIGNIYDNPKNTEL